MEDGLIEYLTKYADELEAQTGAPDPEIRAKIAELKVSVRFENSSDAVLTRHLSLTAGYCSKRLFCQGNFNSNAGFYSMKDCCAMQSN